MYPLYMQQIKLFNCILKLIYLYQKGRILPLFVTHTFFLHEVFSVLSREFPQKTRVLRTIFTSFGVKVGRNG